MSRLIASLSLVFALAVVASRDARAESSTVPDAVGLAEAAGRALVAQGGFDAQVVYSKQGPVGIVFSQEPGGLATRSKGSTVVLQVGGEAKPVAPTPAEPLPPPPGEGPDPGTEPSPLPPMEPTPTAPEPAPPTPPAATPSAPSAGIPSLAELTPEELPNREGPPLPNALGQNRVRAEQLLRGWALNVELTLGLPNLQGKVVSQIPFPSEHLAQGEPVTIVVAVTQPPSLDHRSVPQATGKTMADAAASVRKAGFAIVWRSVQGLQAEAGKVVSQSPLPGSLALKGTSVVLRVGRGTGAPGEAPTPPPPGEPSEETPPTGPLPDPPTLPPTEPLPVPQPPPVEPPPVEPPPVEPPPLEPPPPAEPVPEEPVPVEPTPPEPPPPPAPTPPAATTLVGPADGDSFPRAYGATFQWKSVPGATGYEWELQAEKNGEWQAVALQPLLGTRFRPARMEVGRFRWRVRAVKDGTPGSWTDFRRLFMY
jgi:beta-lactam-binding protein with PASTA domain